MASLVALWEGAGLPETWRLAVKAVDAPHRVLAEVETVEDAERLVGELRPDLVLLDVRGGIPDPLDACRRLSRADGGAGAVVAFASGLDDEERARFLDAGASGYVLTSVDASSLAIALEAIADFVGSGGGPSPAARVPRGRSRAEFLSLAAMAAAIGLASAATARGAGVDPRPSPSEPGGMPELPPRTEGESDVLRMQRELIRAMGKPVGERKWVMVIDQRKCTGCDACTISCKTENQLPPGVVYRPVVEETLGTYPNVGRRFLPRPCMQCENPPCTPVCPVGATWRREDGITAIDYDKCIGCRYCLTACPYSARTSDFGEFYTEHSPGGTQPYEKAESPEYLRGFSRESHGSPIGNARKCHFCLHRLENGMLPSCVTSCIGHATFFGDAGDPDSLVAELIAQPNARRLKEELGTEPRVWYLT